MDAPYLFLFTNFVFRNNAIQLAMYSNPFLLISGAHVELYRCKFIGNRNGAFRGVNSLTILIRIYVTVSSEIILLEENCDAILLYRGCS